MSDVVLEPVLHKPQSQAAATNRNINECYWRRGSNEVSPGWIIIGPGPETEQARRWKDGAASLLLN